MAIIKPNNNTISAITALPAAISTGKVLQVQTYAKTSSTQFSSGASGNLHTGVNITPSSTSNKILIIASVYMEANGDNGNYGETLLYKGSTNLAYLIDAVSYQVPVGARQNLAISYLDSPSTTSEISYSLHHKNISGTARTYTYYRTYYNLLEIAG
jgi:hypothetical protein